MSMMAMMIMMISGSFPARSRMGSGVRGWLAPCNQSKCIEITAQHLIQQNFVEEKQHILIDQKCEAVHSVC